MPGKKRQKQKSLEDRFKDKAAELHPAFLEAIREVYPLAVLGSLCIAIAAFTTQGELINAQTYAIIASSLFLVSFVCSLTVKTLQFDFAAVISYICVFLGIVSLFLVIFEFSRNIPMVGKTFVIMWSLLGLLLTTLPIVEGVRYLRSKTETRIAHHLGSMILISWLAMMTCSYSLFFDVKNIIMSVIGILSIIFFVLFIAGVTFALIFLCWKRRREKHERQVLCIV